VILKFFARNSDNDAARAIALYLFVSNLNKIYPFTRNLIRACNLRASLDPSYPKLCGKLSNRVTLIIRLSLIGSAAARARARLRMLDVSDAIAVSF